MRSNFQVHFCVLNVPILCVVQVLRLLCLQSVCNNGFKQKTLEYYKREILQVGVANRVKGPRHPPKKTKQNKKSKNKKELSKIRDSAGWSLKSNPHWTSTQFDIACIQCGHSHLQQQVPFACVAPARTVWIGPLCLESCIVFSKC